MSRVKIYNLWAEENLKVDKLYKNDLKAFEIEAIPCLKVEPINIPTMTKFCLDAIIYLSKHEKNTIAVHCNNGEHRTGTMVCAFLIFYGITKLIHNKEEEAEPKPPLVSETSKQKEKDNQKDRKREGPKDINQADRSPNSKGNRSPNPRKSQKIEGGLHFDSERFRPEREDGNPNDFLVNLVHPRYEMWLQLYNSNLEILNLHCEKVMDYFTSKRYTKRRKRFTVSEKRYLKLFALTLFNNVKIQSIMGSKYDYTAEIQSDESNMIEK